MRRLPLPILLIVLSTSLANSAEASGLCGKVAEIEDAGEFDNLRNIGPEGSNQKVGTDVEIDLDGDGVTESVALLNAQHDMNINGRNALAYAPEYRSTYARPDGIINYGDVYYGVLRNQGILTMLWRFERSETGQKLKGTPVCFFDRQWTETRKCSWYGEDHYSRLTPVHPKNFGLGKPSEYEKPPFLDEVFDYYEGVIKYGAPVEIDYDNDGKVETVDTVVIELPSPASKFQEIPVTANDADGKNIEPTFQNQRIMQYLSREGSGDFGHMSFLIPRSGYGDVLVDETIVPSPFNGAPRKPFRKVYRIRGNWPETLCEGEFAWKTVFTTEDTH